MLKFSKKPLILTALTLALGLGLYGCGKLWPGTNTNQNANVNQNQNANLNTNATTTGGEIDTSDWQTYRNEEYGFGVKYPNNWILNELEKGVSIKYSKEWKFGMKEGFAPFSIIVMEENLQNFIKSYESDFLDGAPLTRIISQESYNLNEKLGTKLVGNNAVGINSYYIFITHNQKNYLISFNENEELQRAMLSTFYFLK
ncbi:MAG: hypothetical protein A2663_04425 [Candidatus Buchananbacteria bacterium RIFCSPHIGHO2_01_FULL_46_12]|uniref:PsbP C-terminal domain-containing protein n=3 Tax=Candidatus Buchananiibacteriota TaxID=1817903 RepID=A0A1G1YKL0_9BACT|nr:MAG: hypothetical protein A2663_04425 [Candidatus Buchananbacteria bacterium RIFCSPHIGHO2_01_FULL_46_12]OGY52885.1 MAG: hypothetical protein A3B15_01810 [Candidatus Buchananbacteria bacterium RIFCSPLOWO2_01_FULL_45_31]OGY56611.1 MAG: hypothetical protein A3H67_04110 [Candidatus Buchananbacteria bacterium RIFCSPLOWO2_02_FULL_46_11b]